jgi:F-type H+-transporting ATPase subunit b
MKSARMRLALAMCAITFACVLIVPAARAVPSSAAALSGQTTPSPQTATPSQATPTAQSPAREETIRAEEAKVEEQPDPLHTTAGKALRWLNFAIVIIAIGYVIVKKGGPAFRARADEISAGITSAATAKAEADAQLRKAEAGFARLDQDAAAMREESKKEFEAESERLRVAGEQDVARIETAAGAEISAARRAAQMELRAMAARLAAARAAEMVPAQITSPQRAALVKQFVDELPMNDGRGAN